MNLSTPAGRERINIAVLIDGDNAQPVLLEKILLEVARYGRPTIRRIYGDWTAGNMGSWKVPLHDHAIAPVQQFRNSIGKNATDSALIIDAMDILNSHQVRGFCIVSSDSDYTRLATRIREDGILVIGVGKRMTPQAFVKACDVFIVTENLIETKEPAAVAAAAAAPTVSMPLAVANAVKTTKPAKPAAPKPARVVAAKVAAAKPAKVVAAKPAKVAAKPPAPASKPAPAPQPEKKGQLLPPLNMLRKAFGMSVQEDGWAQLAAMGIALRQMDPAFDSRTWGYPQLSQLVAAASDHFELKLPSGPGIAFVAPKNRAKGKREESGGS